ncbi:MAG: M24 family metallopeptidase [Bacteroidales bacterium]|jgi:Xaa-Pro aminopeptidase|nr:M24 family metallopeptidase [Bacteroidales bacterium]
MKYDKIPQQLFIKNRQKAINKIHQNSAIILVSNDEMPRTADQYFSFRQNSDFLYFSGIDQEESILIIAPQHLNKKYREALFLKKTNEHIAIWEGHKYTKEEAKEISGIENIYWLEDFEAILRDVMAQSQNIYLNISEDIRFQPVVERNEKRFYKELKEKFPLHQYQRFAPIVNELRTVKETEEIELLKRACEITEKAFYKTIKHVKPGVWEYELEAEMTAEMIRNRATGHSFPPIIASGRSSCVLHYINNNKQLQDGDLLLMDFGAEYANYAGDITRTIPVNGKFSPRQREVYQACLNVYNEAKKMFVPGNTINKLHAEVCKIMEKELIKIGLLKQEDVDKQNPEQPLFRKYFMHGTSHFIGLDVHDVGSKDAIFEKGMVLSCEPGIYILEENIGIRIETDIVVDDNPIDLMANVPVEIDDIEALMAKNK